MQVKSFTAPGPPEPNLEQPEPSQSTSLPESEMPLLVPVLSIQTDRNMAGCPALEIAPSTLPLVKKQL